MTVENPEKHTLRGFVLTRQWTETRSGLDIIYWLWTNQGPSRIRLTQQESVCFIKASQESQAHKILRAIKGWKVKKTGLKDFAGDPVSALYFNSQRLLYSVRERLSKVGIVCYEADIKPPDRFLMERFICGGVEVNAEIYQRENYQDLIAVELKPADQRPALRAVSIDIETDFEASTLYSIALYSDVASVVLMIGENSEEQSVKAEFDLQFFQDEKSLILAFLKLIEEMDVDVLIGWNVVNFDLKCLQQFSDRAGVKFKLGRNAEEVRWRQSADGSDRSYALVPGRVVLDGIELMRTATYQFENFSLEHVSRQLLGRGKLVDDVDQRGAEITNQFHHAKAELAKYNLEDCRLVWDIFEKEKLIDFAIERSLLTGLEMDRYGGSVAAIDFLYLPRLHRQGLVAPALEEINISGMSPGGYVMNSIPGIHKNVVILDFKSLYPSIIRTFNVDPLGLVRGLDEDGAIMGFDGGRFSRTQHILPGLIRTLWEARDKAKAKNNSVLSQAIKIIMNSFYGVFGTQGCRFYDPRLVNSITKRGHEIIIQSKKQIESKGFQVIYGDTDSVFVLLKDAEIDEVEQIANNLVVELNQWWKEKLASEHGVESFLEMEFETHFTKFLMPTVRGSDAGSKKRYAGLSNTNKLIFKGLESVRSDWSPLAREFQKTLYSKIFYDQPFSDYIKETVEALNSGNVDDKLVLRKRLRRKLEDYVKNVPPHVQAARKAERIREARGLPLLYQSGGWIEYVMTVNGPEPKQYLQSVIDYNFYIERQLSPIADSILVFQSLTMDEILNKQIGLF